MGLHCFKKWWNNSKKQDILYSKGQVHWIVGKCVKGKKRHHSLQWRICHCGALVIGLYTARIRLCVYGAVTNWCETLGRTESVKVLRNRNMNTEGNQFFGEDTTSTTSFGEPNASETSKFRVSFSEKSTRTSSWKSNISSSSGEDLVLSDSFWCWRWMREHHPNVQRTPGTRELLGSRCFATINANAQIGPVLNAHISKLCGIHGIEVQFQSLSQPDCFFMDFDMQRTWEICGGVTLLRLWNSHP